ncbi:putative peroxisome assembly protein 12 [Hydractinia symbiolongicarpus]|uniref:putative peroxisome assembly protein 12 n=1 Tax=Hydractinia symbiolongicarpus TaxID=13093 RepID=UPI00254A6D72|nr:putative peroxisome assembly protein 12 [Hydractinia symbiolongicarpus]
MDRLTTAQFLYTSSAKASLFDIVSEESLKSSLKPAWEYFCKVLRTKWPQVTSKVLRYPDELFYVFLFVLEEYNLRKKSASITESFYELTRESTAAKSSVWLRKAKWISLAAIVLLPYLTGKLDKFYERVKARILASENDVTSLEIWIYNVYPILLTGAKWIRIVNYILYLFNFTSYASPLLYFTRIQLKYAKSNNPPIDDKENKSYRLVNYLTDSMASIASRMTPLLFYSLQFVDAFYQQDTSLQSSALSVTEPPSMPKVLSTDSKLPPSKQQCPLCRCLHVNPTTTSVSGFVFCYACIHKYIDKFGCCPITYRSCDVTDLIQLHP